MEHKETIKIMAAKADSLREEARRARLVQDCAQGLDPFRPDGLVVLYRTDPLERYIGNSAADALHAKLAEIVKSAMERFVREAMEESQPKTAQAPAPAPIVTPEPYNTYRTTDMTDTGDIQKG